jgi:iron complex transport system ATP-binding protein
MGYIKKMKKSLCVENLFAYYDKNLVLKDVSLIIEQGELVCITGANGCGKSTLLSVMAHLTDDSLHIKNSIGPVIKSDDNSEIVVSSLKRKEIAQRIAFMSQNEFSTWNFSVQDIVLTGRYPYTKNGFYTDADYQKADEMISLLEISELASKNIHEISGGEFQKVRIARALTQATDFILLDEPTSGLDFIYEGKTLSFLRDLAHEKGLGIAVVIHNLNLALQYADKICLMPKNKKNYFGIPSEVVTKENLFDSYNENLTVYNHPLLNCMQIESML